MARLIVDTGVLIGGARGTADFAELAGTDDVAVPAVVVAEYVAGVLLDGDPARRAARRAFLEEVLMVVPVAEYDRTVAEHHAELLAHTRRTGGQRSAHDLIIAATARATGRIVVTTDRRAAFDELPDVEVRVVL